jgi:hypothetical protein
VKDVLQEGKQFFIGIVTAALVDNRSRALRKSSIYNRREGPVCANPSFGPIHHPTLL